MHTVRLYGENKGSPRIKNYIAVLKSSIYLFAPLRSRNRKSMNDMMTVVQGEQMVVNGGRFDSQQMNERYRGLYVSWWRICCLMPMIKIMNTNVNISTEISFLRS